jgi:hypothetical protein
MEFPKMLYKAGGPEDIHGGHFSTKVVNDEAEQEAALADGWHLTTPEAAEALAPKKEEDQPPTRAELEAKAAELGIDFAKNIGDAKLAAKIAEALAPK